MTDYVGIWSEFDSLEVEAVSLEMRRGCSFEEAVEEVAYYGGEFVLSAIEIGGFYA